MRIVFINLHANEMLVKTLPKYVFKQSVAIKHRYLIDYLLNDNNIEVCSYINERGFDLFHNGAKVILLLANSFRFIESSYILKKNGINKKKVHVLRSLDEIRPDDIVILYRHHGEQLLGMEKVTAFKVVSMIHFWGQRDEAKKFSRIRVDCFISESDLRKNSEIYRRFYNADIPFIIHPFVFEERFIVSTPFSQRKNKAVAMGTITYKNDPDFLEVYGDPCDQPSRKQIKDNAEFFEDTIDCYSSDYNEDSTVKKVEKGDNKIIEFYKKLYNRMHTGQQKKYYSFNMVDKYNEYKMCIVGEEVLGVPGIGFVEGMACGCAYIGLDSPMYRDLGLLPGVHYISYDGTIENLKQVIEYYQMDDHQVELEDIARRGCEYVRNQFNGKKVAADLVYRIIEQQKEWKNDSH